MNLYHTTGHATMDVAVAMQVAGLAEPTSEGAVHHQRAHSGDAYHLSSLVDERMRCEQALDSFDHQVARDNVLGNDGDQNAYDLEPVQTKGVTLAIRTRIRIL